MYANRRRVYTGALHFYPFCHFCIFLYWNLNRANFYINAPTFKHIQPIQWLFCICTLVCSAVRVPEYQQMFFVQHKYYIVRLDFVIFPKRIVRSSPKPHLQTPVLVSSFSLLHSAPGCLSPVALNCISQGWPGWWSGWTENRIYLADHDALLY